MSDTLPNITLTPNVWVDLMAVSGIAGTRMIVQNVGVCDVYLASQLAQPVDDLGHYVLERGVSAINETNDEGVWALCLSGCGAVNVKQVS